jgi:hypothetical protein
MDFTWDQAKNRRNTLKHKLSFDTAKLVFNDPNALSVKDRVVEGEERWQTVGMAGGVVLLVAHTYQVMAENEFTRIISARKATPQERRIYEKRNHETPN